MSAHPVFVPALRAFGGAAYDQVAHLDQKAVIAVPRIEVDLPSHNPGDAETWRTAVLTDDQVRLAYETLAKSFSDEFETIATKIATGELA
jgi:hypothetical protein